MRVRNIEELGLLIRHSRKARKWSQGKLAEVIGVSRNWVVSIENGRSGAEIGLVMKALHALDLSLVVRAHTPVEQVGAPPAPPTEESTNPKNAPGVHTPLQGPSLTRRGRPLGSSRGRNG